MKSLNLATSCQCSLLIALPVYHRLLLDTNGRYLLSFLGKFWRLYHFILRPHIDK